MDGKERAGVWASEQVKDGMIVGLGTGSTAAYFIKALANRVKNEGLKIQMASSSYSTALLAEELGLPLLPLEQVEHLDLYADGADEVDPEKRLIKGRGAGTQLPTACERITEPSEPRSGPRPGSQCHGHLAGRQVLFDDKRLLAAFGMA